MAVHLAHLARFKGLDHEVFRRHAADPSVGFDHGLRLPIPSSPPQHIPLCWAAPTDGDNAAFLGVLNDDTWKLGGEILDPLGNEDGCLACDFLVHGRDLAV